MVEKHAERVGLAASAIKAWPNAALARLSECKRVLMLQGPVGPFFSDMSEALQRHGVETHKVNFNSGDHRFFTSGHFFKGGLDEWADHLHHLISEFHPQACVMFGQDRPVHIVARRVLKEAGIDVLVMEEGYVRPNFVTFEINGVNSHSSFQWDEARVALSMSSEPVTHQAPNFQLPFHKMAWLACQYHLMAKLGSPVYPEYQHHRPSGILMEAIAWLKTGWIKTWAPKEADQFTQQLLADGHPRYYLVPLQVHNDAQLKHHSGYSTVGAFLDDVLDSFLRYAPADTTLVIKHHPMNRGHRDYSGQIAGMARSRGQAHRVIYLRDGHLPTLLEHALGTVVINSTVGLSSMFHGTPVKTLGRALYDLPGLTHSGELDEFWTHPEAVDPHLFHRFLQALIADTQLPGTFYWPSKQYMGLLEAIENRVAAAATARKLQQHPVSQGKFSAQVDSGAAQAPLTGSAGLWK
jgi:capsular polysaccharide export protein